MSAMLDNLLRPVLTQIAKLWARVDLMPVVRWGTVTASSPLRVVLDGDGDPLPYPPVSAIPFLAVGERVVCIEQHRRIIIVQVAGHGVTDGWVTPVLSNGFLHHPTAPLQYRISHDRVALRGAVYRSSVTTPAGSYMLVFQLPNDRTLFPTGQVREAGRADAGQSVAVTSDGGVLMLITQAVTGGIGLPFDGINWDR